MSKQEQQLEGGEAYQAGRDLTVNKSMSPDQMMEIMAAMAKQLALFQQEARKTVDLRLGEFRDEVLRRFSNSDEANPEAFKDPDFQFLLNKSQEAYARVGTERLRTLLGDIIARRSKANTRTRLAITLNQAAEKIPLLTDEELATLSLIFCLRYSADSSVNSCAALATYLIEKITPLARSISRERSSFWHLEAQSTGSISVAEAELFKIIHQSYGGLLSNGFDEAELMSIIGNINYSNFSSMIGQCLREPSKLQFLVINKQTFNALLERKVDSSQQETIWKFFEGTYITEAVFCQDMINQGVDYVSIRSAWDDTDNRRFNLNATGIAIGNANAASAVGLNAPIDIWIK